MIGRGYRIGSGMGPAVKGLLIAIAAASVGALLLRGASRPAFGWLVELFLLTPESVLPGFFLWQPLTYVFFHFDPIDLLFGLFLLWMFGNTFEAQWGSRAFLRFFFVASAGAGVVATVLGLMFPGSVGVHTYAGSWPALEALVAAFAVTFPESPIYLFFVLPIKGKHLLVATLAITLLFALSAGTLVPFVTPLAGLGIGALLAGGRFQPRRAWLALKAQWLEWRYRRARRHLRPIDGESDRRDRWVH